MKTLILTIASIAAIILCTTSLFAAAPVKANMESMIEGQMVYEVPLNTHVKKGQLVEEVDPSQYKEEVKSDIAIINYDTLLYKADSKLYKTRSISLETMLGAKRNYEEALQAFNEAQTTIKHCKVYAPFAGTVSYINVYPGSGLGDGNLIMTITKTQA
ncbi:MAG TPA: hypothetical protein QF753_04300 [Victivallales bacterium]|nr:hypothetical protein [Victivallales bacterium]